MDFFKETVLPIFNAIALVLNIILGYFNLKTYSKNKADRGSKLRKEIRLKEIEIEKTEREYKRDREKVFNELDGYRRENSNVLINGSNERFPDYQRKQQMDDFDSTYSERINELRTELFHLQELNGETFILASNPGWKYRFRKVLNKLKFW